MKRIDPAASPSIESLLIHGLNNTGKTHILGAMLSHERQAGPCVYVNMTGEPLATLFAHDLDGVELVEIEKVEEISELVKSLGHVHAIALDSVARLGEMAGVKVTGGTSLVGAKEDHGREWAKLKFETFKGLMLLKGSCDLFVAVCPSRHHENAITHAVRIVPDVSGVSEVLVGRFNFVGYLEAITVSPTIIRRVLDFQPRVDVVTRFNAKKGITGKLDIPMGLDCWTPIQGAIESALRGE